MPSTGGQIQGQADVLPTQPGPAYGCHIVDVAVERPRTVETTALGAACLAGLQAGVYRSIDDIGARWVHDTEFMPRMSARERERLVLGWESAVARTLEHRG